MFFILAQHIWFALGVLAVLYKIFWYSARHPIHFQK